MEPGSNSPYRMIDLPEAQQLLIEASVALEIELVSLRQASGRVVAEELKSSVDFPEFRASIMVKVTQDGFAVASIETPGSFQLAGAVRAGENPVALSKGQIAYITTGAALPDFADAVVPIEDTAKEGDLVVLPKTSPGTWVRQIGSDVKRGEIVAKIGDRLTPGDLAVLASIGIAELPVIKRPIVGILSTGDELIEFDQPSTGSQIRDTNRLMLAELLKGSCEIKDYGQCTDTVEKLEATLLQMTQECNFAITSGGVSLGDHDLVKPILERAGKVLFGRLNLKPGKPTTVARIGDCIVFALPGNPVSCFVTYHVLVDYMVRHLSLQPQLPVVQVEVVGEVSLDPRPEFHRVTVAVDGAKLRAVSTGNQRSSRLMSTRGANGLLLLPMSTTVQKTLSGTVPAMLIGPLVQMTKDMQPEPVNKHQGCHCCREQPTLKTKVGILTVSDRAYTGEYQDLSGVIIT